MSFLSKLIASWILKLIKLITFNNFMLEKIDMSKYSPYKKMKRTIITREIEDKKVIWPYYERKLYDGAIKIRIIEKKDCIEVAELWRMNYGELYGSTLKYDWVLYPKRYESNVAFKENWDKDSLNKDFCMLVFEETNTRKIFGAWALFKDDRNLQIEFSLGVIHPEYRQQKSGIKVVSTAVDYIKVLENESGAEYLTSFCETFHNVTQFLCFKRWGFKVAGIFPGQYTRWNGDQQEYRACEVHFYKFIRGSEKYVSKSREIALLPEFKKLWDVLEEINKNSDDKALKKY